MTDLPYRIALPRELFGPQALILVRGFARLAAAEWTAERGLPITRLTAIAQRHRAPALFPTTAPP